MFKLTGKIKVKKETEVISDKFSKREFVLTDESSMYPQDISFQLTQDKCGLIDNWLVGSNVEVSFNLRGREWTSPQGEVRYFNTIEAWRIEAKSDNDAPAVGSHKELMEKATAPAADDDLPF